jgi:hypothetical protein
VPLVTARAPGLLRLYSVGPDAAALLIAAGDHTGRLRRKPPERCRAGPASSGKVTWHRPGCGGGQAKSRPVANCHHPDERCPPTRAYVTRRSKEGLPKP